MQTLGYQGKMCLKYVIMKCTVAIFRNATGFVITCMLKEVTNVR